MLDLRYDPVAREGYVKLRPGRSVRTRPLSTQAQAEYDRRGQLLSISIHDLDQTAAEFLRTSDEETLLRVIAAQAGAGKAGIRRAGPPPKSAAKSTAPARPKAKAKPKPKPKPKPEAAASNGASPEGAPKRRRRRRRPRGGGGAGQPAGGESGG